MGGVKTPRLDKSLDWSLDWNQQFFVFSVNEHVLNSLNLKQDKCVESVQVKSSPINVNNNNKKKHMWPKINRIFLNNTNRINCTDNNIVNGFF